MNSEATFLRQLIPDSCFAASSARFFVFNHDVSMQKALGDNTVKYVMLITYMKVAYICMLTASLPKIIANCRLAVTLLPVPVSNLNSGSFVP